MSARLRGRPRWRIPSAKRGSLMICVERLGEPVLAGDRRALGPDDRQRQPRQVVALEARPQARAQEGRLARSRRAEDDEHARDAGAREPADLVEPAHDLRVAAEEDRGVLLLEIGKSGIGPAACLEGEARRVEAGALQPLLEAPVGVRVAGEIDELLVGEVERNLRSCRSRQAPRSPSCPSAARRRPPTCTSSTPATPSRRAPERLRSDRRPSAALPSSAGRPRCRARGRDRGRRRPSRSWRASRGPRSPCRC